MAGIATAVLSLLFSRIGSMISPFPAALALLVTTASISAQADWIDLTATVTGTPGIPSNRIRGGVTSDGSTMLLFGGNAGGTEFADFWSYDPLTDHWTELGTVNGPAARRRCQMAWDEDDNVLVLFGGSPTGATTASTQDTWEWDSTNGWVDVTPALGNPPIRSAGTMAWDPVTGHVMMFGGENGSQLGDTWLWNATNNTWTEHLSVNPQPAARNRPSLVTDPVQAGVLLVGGRSSTNAYFSDTWRWDGTDWTEVIPSTPGGGGPHAADGGVASMGLTYDALRDRFVMFGGVLNNGSTFRTADTWEYDRSTWTQTAATIPATVATPARNAVCTVYVASAQTTCLFGGFLGSGGAAGALGDTLEYQTAAIATATTFGSSCAGSAGTPTLSVTGLPWQGDLVRLELGSIPPAPAISVISIGFSNTVWAGIPLPLDLGPFGSPGCFFHNSQDVNVSATSTPINMPIGTSAGFTFFAQAVVVETTLTIAVSPSVEFVVGTR